MQRFLNILKNCFLILIIGLGIFLVVKEVSFWGSKDFVSPLPSRMPLIIRNDLYGDGYFGAQRSGRRRHTGIDFTAPVGTPVRAAKSGWIVAARYSRGLGNLIEIYHKQSLLTLYAHLDTINVKMLQRVRQGEVIATVGKTGNANYKGMLPHLHFEIFKDGLQQDPLAWLPGIKIQTIILPKPNDKKIQPAKHR
jgi:murein DD-endopeptidase MepM/ murein hydrolase activator NlpD